MNRFILIALILLSAVTLLAIDENAGSKGFLFLQIPSSPELAGMANTGNMLHSSPGGMFHHPVAFNWERGKAVSATNSMWLVDTYLYNIAYRNVMFDNAFGVALKYMDYGQIDERDHKGTKIGDYYPMDLHLMGNYARKLTPDIHIGANFNMLYQKISTSSAIGFSGDIGAVYLTPLRNTSVDIAFRNIGGTTKMDKESIELPFTIDFGLAAGYELNESVTIQPAFKLTYMNDHDDLLPAAGINVRIMELLCVRAGYKFNYNEEDFSAGFSVVYKNFQLDYAFLNNNIEGVNSVNKFGLTYRF